MYDTNDSSGHEFCLQQCECCCCCFLSISPVIHTLRVLLAKHGGGNRRYFGGVVAFNQEDFEAINGFPNTFWGWGGEDDEMYSRIVEVILLSQISVRQMCLGGVTSCVLHEPQPAALGVMQFANYFVCTSVWPTKILLLLLLLLHHYTSSSTAVRKCTSLVCCVIHHSHGITYTLSRSSEIDVATAVCGRVRNLCLPPAPPLMCFRVCFRVYDGGAGGFGISTARQECQCGIGMLHSSGFVVEHTELGKPRISTRTQGVRAP